MVEPYQAFDKGYIATSARNCSLVNDLKASFRMKTVCIHPVN